ncbi:MAG: bifunctional folylpolyglutamate synthase/dihydrofolate synthase [Spirochaetaceae bacterium]|nr:MAG: bifunctional folylpolyglutamate synthase/dihydrofolate synthase [Spirochaetaceae bacterium]
MPADVERGFAWFESFTNLEKGRHVPREYRLDRMRALLAAFNNPHRDARAVHVAGSKGKGSTAAFLQSILTAAGYRVGGYYSPHVTSYRERFVLTPQPAADRDLLPLMRRIEAHVRRSMARDPNAEPTTFELLTLLAFLLFRESQVDWVVLETGLGGRLDATNVVTPAASVITPIELEHTEYLGTTVAQIAAEKSGIIKPGVPLFVSRQKPEARDVILSEAQRLASPVWQAEHGVSELRVRGSSAGFTLMPHRERFTLELRLPGEHQARNAALAAAVVRHLLPQLAHEIITDGLNRAWLPGRLERISGAPACYLDGAHTADSLQAVVQAFCPLTQEPRILLFGAAAGKDVPAMARVLASTFSTVVVTRAGNFKPGDPAAAVEAFTALGVACILEPEPAAALQRACRLAGSTGSVLVTGSFYTVGAVRAVDRSTIRAYS